VSVRCEWLPRAAISTSREWAAIGEVAPLLLAAGTQGPSPADSHHQYESINRTDASTVVGYRPSSLHVIDAFDLAARDSIGKHHRKGSERAIHTAKAASALLIPPRPLPTAEPPPSRWILQISLSDVHQPKSMYSGLKLNHPFVPRRPKIVATGRHSGRYGRFAGPSMSMRRTACRSCPHSRKR
jgi:hypothetical protein